MMPVTATAEMQINVKDDAGLWVHLPRPAQRIVSLSPHLTEMLFELGVGDLVVGTVSYADFPKQAQGIPRIGNAFSVNVEAVVELAPDVIIAWQTGGANRALQKLRSLGYPIYINEAPSLESIAASARKIARLVGQEHRGGELADSFLTRLAELRQEPGGKRLFFQISDENLYTVNRTHLIGQALSLCGGTNIFADVSAQVPLVSQESVLSANPEIIFYTLVPGDRDGDWVGRWSSMLVNTQLIAIDPNVISRPSLRMLEGIELICNGIVGN
jgi:iron complex transport system substrate-binding protein